MKKYIVSFFILIIIIQIFCTNQAKADSTRYQYNGNIGYIGYQERINAIKNNHPNWNFVIMETGLDWNDVIANEYTGHHTSPKNLIQGKSGGWICSICGEEAYDTGEWMCASEQTIKYYMDPRNHLVDSPYLFQFLQTDYTQTSDEDVYSALNGTFLYSMDNAKVINSVCREKNANPYFIIARIIQEQGNAGGDTYKMIDTDGKVYYNLFNIGAGGNGNEVYQNALSKARTEGWTSIESCIRGGISFLLSSYIEYKQNTIYLNKFDVETYKGVYAKQYMQNIEAPKTEAVSMYNKMNKANLLDKNLTFIIPVYENMPNTACASPDTMGELYPKNIRVKEGHSRIVIRAGRSTSTSVVGYINDSNTIILSVERYEDGWHKIILSDGIKGYVKFNSSYLEEVDDVVNCKETVTTSENTVLRVGPGYNQVEITYLPKGEEVTRIDNSGMYNFDGKVWDRVKISDGRQGFVIRDYITKKDETNNNTPQNTIAQNETIINQTIETNQIQEPTNQIEENIINEPEEDQLIEEANEIDEVPTEDENINNNENEDITENTKSVEDDTKTGERKYFVIPPEKMAEDLGGIVTKNEEETKEAGTGYKIEKDGEIYIIVKRGDVNGDGYVKANDYLIIKDFIMGNNNAMLVDEFLQAADVTNDKAVKANDYLKIKDHIMYNIEL